MIHLIQHSSLDKITRDTLSPKDPYEKDFALCGEELGFQVVVYTDSDQTVPAKIRVDGNGICTTHLVKDVPVTWPHYSKDTKPYLLDQPGMLPDCLIPLMYNDTVNINSSYIVLWITISPSYAGDQVVTTTVTTDTESASCELSLHVVDTTLPKQYFSFCQYIDPHAIARDHHVPMFSDVYWRILQNYFRFALRNGFNDIVVPLFTPEYAGYPTDERIQLVDIEVLRNNYAFRFDLMDSWIYLAKECGFENFTFPVFLPSYKTMRGARFTAKQEGRRIELLEDEGVDSNYYTSFIRKLLYELVKRLEEHKIPGRITLYFSAGPKVYNENDYYKFRAHFFDRVKKYRIADYDVEYDFYALDRVGVPYVHLHDVNKYIGHTEATVYGCFDITNPRDVINPLIAASSLRLRALGAYCYRNDVVGFHHMGFNYSAPPLKEAQIDPYINTDYGHRYPSGSLSMVYPGAEEPYPSIRLKQIKYAIQDYRLLDKLQLCCTPKKLNGLIDQYLKITPDSMVDDPERFQKLRAKLYELAEKLTKK